MHEYNLFVLHELHVLNYHCLQILRDDLQLTVDRLFNLTTDAISNVTFANDINETEHAKLIKSLNSIHKHYGKPLPFPQCTVNV